LLIVGHGTREPSGVAQFRQLVYLVRDRSTGWLPGVDGGFIELAAPPVGEVVSRLMGSGPAELVAIPLVLSAAGHGKGDIPAALAREQVRHPGRVPDRDARVHRQGRSAADPAPSPARPASGAQPRAA
jgi:sirohydrochlorin cobaltochelatase